MKITDIVYINIDELNEMPKFDLRTLPKKPKWYLEILAWFLSFPETFAVHSKIKKHNMKGLKEPFIMLCSHNSFLDFKVATKAIFPKRATYIVAVDGFINREEIMKNVGCFAKRKFVNDYSMVKKIAHSVGVNKTICQIYPEARYSLVGTTSPLPKSLGKLIKLTEFPVVTLISHGHHLRQPVWNLKKRKVKSTSNMTQILTREQIKSMSVDEINSLIKKVFIYNDYAYQLENNIEIKEDFRAENLHKPLYMCPHCNKEHKMNSKGIELYCEHCGVTYEMDFLGRLKNTNGKTIFSHIPDWFEWQREQVKNEILKGLYQVELEVDIDILPNSTGFYRLGTGTLIHNSNGYVLKGENFSVVKPVKANFGVHIEYDYFGRGDGISFSHEDNTYYMYPKNQNYSVTKFHLATEELYKIEVAKK